MNTYEPIIGLEVHVELRTVSKMFCGCPNDWFGKEPNTQTCPVCLGLPGALPVPNKKAIEWCIKLGIALHCQIPEFSKFDRKNYFYPDLPKGYQISQYDKPFAIQGWLDINNPITQSSNNPINNQNKKRIGIRRVHLEEDTGKLLHATVEGKNVTLIDFNRSGVPLVEIVTEPDFRNTQEVDVFLKKLQQIIRYLGISGADMEKGSMRLEPSISMRQKGSKDLPDYRVELKNINSFRFVRNALEAEISRQTQNPKERYQATRRYDEKTNKTVIMRRKEEAHDYRYFPEPDTPPYRWRKEYLSEIKYSIPELPDQKRNRFMKDFALNDYDASLLIDTAEKADYFEEAVKIGGKHNVLAKTIANWIINKKIDLEKVGPSAFIETIIKETIREELPENELKHIIKDVLSKNQKAVDDYKKGKLQVFMFLVGQVMREAKGKANPEKVKQIISKFLS